MWLCGLFLLLAGVSADGGPKEYRTYPASFIDYGFSEKNSQLAEKAVFRLAHNFDVFYVDFVNEQGGDRVFLMDNCTLLNHLITKAPGVVIMAIGKSNECNLTTSAMSQNVLLVESLSETEFKYNETVHTNWDVVEGDLLRMTPKVYVYTTAVENGKQWSTVALIGIIALSSAVTFFVVLGVTLVICRRRKPPIVTIVEKPYNGSATATAIEVPISVSEVEIMTSGTELPKTEREPAGQDPRSDVRGIKLGNDRDLEAMGKQFDHYLVPISQAQFVKNLERIAKHCVDYYNDSSHFPVTTKEKPGFLYNYLPKNAPEEPEEFEDIMDDFNNKVLRGLTHWHHPRFHAFFPTARNFACILAETMVASLGVVGFSYDSCPSLTEMEHGMINWVGRALGIPESFLFQDVPAESQGGGTIFESSSDITFCTIIAARQKKIKQLAKKDVCKVSEAGGVSYDLDVIHDLCRKFVAYTSKDAHSCIEKGAKIAMIRCRPIQATAANDWGITGEQLEKEIKKDIAKGLIPIHVHCTLGTTSTAASDHLQSLWPIAKKYNMWLHVDAAYSGSCWICPKYRINCAGLEHASSINVNGHKFLQHTVGTSFFWTRFQKEYKDAWTITPIFLKPSQDNTIDLRDYSIHLSRRFNSMKTWLLFRLYGLEGMQTYVTRLIDMAAYFEDLVRAHPNCRIWHKRNFTLFCFQYVEPGLSAAEINSCTQTLCQYMNESHKLYFTFTRVDGNSLIRVSTTYEKTTKKTIDDSWAIMKKFIEKFKAKWRKGNLVSKKAGTPLPGHTKPRLPGDIDHDIAGSVNEVTDATRNTVSCMSDRCDSERTAKGEEHED